MLIALNQQITSYTEYWPLVLGVILIVLLFAFPAGMVGSLASLLNDRRKRTDA
jgi:ABC-type branched-subunit amino acid transport system permease subunit